MRQPKPDIARARELSQALLNERLVDFIKADEANTLVETLLIGNQRLSVAPENLEAYLKNPFDYTMAYYTDGDKNSMRSSEVDLQKMTVGATLADFWCGTYAVKFSGLDLIRKAYEQYPERIAALDSWEEKSKENNGSAKKILDLLLGIDTLAKEGNPPQPNAIRDGIGALQHLLHLSNIANAYYSKRALSASELERGHFSSRVHEILQAIILKQAKAIPDYVPDDLRSKASIYYHNDKTSIADRVSLKNALVDLVKKHEPTMTAANYKKEANSLGFSAQHQDVQALFLGQVIMRLREISKALAIPPNQGRDRAG
jgi:hypothetical protein